MAFKRLNYSINSSFFLSPLPRPASIAHADAQVRPQSRPRSRLSRMRQERAERLSPAHAPLLPAAQHEELYFLTDEEELRFLVEVRSHSLSHAFVVGRLLTSICLLT